MGDVTFSKMGWCLSATGMPFGAHFKGRFFLSCFKISGQRVCEFYDMVRKCW